MNIIIYTSKKESIVKVKGILVSNSRLINY